MVGANCSDFKSDDKLIVNHHKFEALRVFKLSLTLTSKRCETFRRSKNINPSRGLKGMIDHFQWRA